MLCHKAAKATSYIQPKLSPAPSADHETVKRPRYTFNAQHELMPERRPVIRTFNDGDRARSVPR